MFLLIYKVILRRLILPGLCFFCSYSNAAPVEIAVDYKTVGDTVQYQPNLPTGGFATAVKKPRFKESNIGIRWQPIEQLSISGGLSKRRFTTLRDDFGFLKTSIGFRYTSQKLKLKNTGFWFNFSSNNATELDKNSYTTINNQVIKSVVIKQPTDRILEFGVDRTFKLSSSTRLLTLISIGSTDTKHAGLEGDLTRGNCEYQFNFSNNGGSVNQLNQCGDITALSRTYPDDNTVQQEFGVSPAIDLRNNSLFSKVGFGFSKDYGKWTFNSHYYFQKYHRDQLDKRIELSQNTAYDRNHVVSTTVQRTITNKLTLSAHAEYQLHRYLDEVPVLYTRLTSERFKDDAVFFSLGLTYSLHAGK